MAYSLRSAKLTGQLSSPNLTSSAAETNLSERLKSDVEENNRARKKRQRESRADDGTNSTKNFKVAVELQGMNVRQLREQAILRGISSSGSKEELMHRISVAQLSEDPKELGHKHEEEEVDEANQTSKMENQLVSKKKAIAMPDQYLPAQIKDNYRVLEEGNNIYDGTLNQTNVGDNNNKFYVIQVLESNDGDKFMVYTRWGRVGIKGQDKLQGPYTSKESAIQEFEAKFFSKTKNHWSARDEFIPHAKCYVLLEMEYETEKESDEMSTIENHHMQTTKLDPRIASFIALICNTEMMNQRMKELGYNVEKLPLGKLSRSTILKGYDVLRRISDIIDESDREKLEELSGEFYTTIPHDFGFRKMRDFVINTHYKVKCKLEMVEALGKIEVANSLFNNEMFSQEDRLHSHYQCLHCELIPLEIGSPDYSMIDKYIHNTGDETYFKISIVNLFKASREGENERFQKFSDTKNRMLLWHGSRLTNWTGILSQGLLIAPPEAPSRGYSFGKGLYFGDMFAKSIPYCGANWINSDAVLVLCEVALGEIHEIQTFKDNSHHLPKGKLSTKAIGRIVPDPSQAQVLDTGLVVPLGNPMDQTQLKSVVHRNEYVIFNEDQIRIRYVAHVKLCYNGTS